ncbi:6-carboxyhexanoate--CoA ligase [Natroniella acetigena]|uniref:6-carboxyhexanoate--CoA ligase n=1 Tax=Natroniella acetigena TaxID=52004 RepID=UPI00200B4440|nr:6-carboxyhexanoate--CoA ligase [Natroniella acetigena]MCK8827446.1 6-carboxyhexanoate--CoA ligase [Natroniella acetigena]
MVKDYFSLRMRATKEQQHISGAERIITAARIESAAAKLIRRAREHAHGQADVINLTLELLENEITEISSLPIRTIKQDDYRLARDEVKDLLVQLGINKQATSKAINLLAKGANPKGENMRGAVIMELTSANRLEGDQFRGVRASRMDYSGEAKERLLKLLEDNELNRTHIPEALALASKVVAHRQIVAELCWSDDPDYTGGYVANQELGYCRFPFLKPEGLGRGGRVFFVQPGLDLSELVDYLEQKPVLVTQLNPNIKEYQTITEVITNAELG